MQNRVIRIVSLALILFVLLPAFVFAGGDAEKSKAATVTTSAALPDNAEEYPWIFEKDPASIKGTVRFWMPFKGDQGMDALIADFNQYYPNVQVELTTYNNNADGNVGVNTAIMAGEVDVLASFELFNAYRRWENNLYIPLDDRMQKEGIDLITNWSTDKYKYNGVTYTFPCGGLAYYVVINKTAWDEAGLGAIPKE